MESRPTTETAGIAKKEPEKEPRETEGEPDGAGRISMLVESLTLSLSFITTSVALVIFTYVFQAHANKVSFTSGGAVSLAVVWSPIVLLAVAISIIFGVFILFSSSLVFEEKKAREAIFLGSVELGELLSHRATTRNVALIVVALALMVLSGIAVGYVFVTRTSDYALLLVEFAIFYLFMLGFTVFFLATVVSNRRVVLVQFTVREEEQPLISEV